MFIVGLCDVINSINAQYSYLMSLNENRDKEAVKLVEKKKKLLDDMQNFIIHSNWASNTTRNMLSFLIFYNFDYRMTCKAFRIQPEHLAAIVTSCDEKISEVMSEAVNYIAVDMPDKARSSFNAAVKHLSAGKGRRGEFAGLLPKPAVFSNVKLSDCSAEISILRCLNKNGLVKASMRCDRRKLAHLLYILGSSDQTYAAEKAELNEAIKG